MVESIQKGNSFYLDYTLTCKNDEGAVTPILIADIEELEVGVQHTLETRLIRTPFTMNENVLSLHITPEFQLGSGKHRIILKGKYQGEEISRNSVAYDLKNNVEEEKKGCCSCVKVRRVAILDNIGVWKGVYGSIINVVDELPDQGIPGQFYAIPE